VHHHPEARIVLPLRGAFSSRYGGARSRSTSAARSIDPGPELREGPLDRGLDPTCSLAKGRVRRLVLVVIDVLLGEKVDERLVLAQLDGQRVVRAEPVGQRLRRVHSGSRRVHEGVDPLQQADPLRLFDRLVRKIAAQVDLIGGVLDGQHRGGEQKRIHAPCSCLRPEPAYRMIV
jgi:hypothetical protein